MFGGGGGMNPRKMKQMMNQMGIDLNDIDAEEVIIRTEDEELVFHDADVQEMDAQGQKTYQIVGEPDTRPRGEGGESTEEVEEAGGEPEIESTPEFSDEDVEIVARRAEVSPEKAREALEETGDLAAAVQQLETE